MWWLFLIVLLIAAIVSRGFRKVLLACIAVLVLIGLVWYLKDANDRELSRRRISAAEIELVDLRLGPGYSSGYRLTGRLRNKSPKYTVTGVTLKIIMKDCITATDCEIVDQASTSLWKSVPPGQARDLDEYVGFSSLGAPRGKHEWSYSIGEITASEAR